MRGPQSAAAGVVAVDGGLIEGARSGAVRRYLGIPYAAAPVGPLRWRPPQPVVRWDGVRAATAFAPQCLQPGRPADSVYSEFAGLQPMSEDCLFLNVWTAAPGPEAKWPVMVWFHGGAFQQGAGSNPVFVQGDLPAQGVVLVTFNYRLGPFGFMAHPQLSAESESGSSGNYGLLDMAAALQWVQRNIAAFGGDPGNVTAFGQSAGAAGVVCLMAAPAARGLFQRAIAQSFGLPQMRSRQQAQEEGARFGQNLALPDLAGLRALSGERLLADYLAQPGRWMPSVDGSFIAEPVATTFAAGRQQPVPLLTGWNTDEGATFPAMAGRAEFESHLARRFGARAQQAGELYPSADDVQARRSSRELFGDELFALGVWRAARAHAPVAPTYLYHFDHAQPLHPGQRFSESDGSAALGAFHSSEYPHVFGTTGVLKRPWRALDGEVTRTMQSRWLAFARTGNPDVPGLPHWPAFDDGRPTVLRLGQDSGVTGVPRRGHLEFLDH